MEKRKLESDIHTHKQELKQNIAFLEEKMEKYNELKNIMEDWKPTNYVDKIAITEIYAMYEYAKGKEKPSMKELKEIEEKLTLSKSEHHIRILDFRKHVFLKC